MAKKKKEADGDEEAKGGKNKKIIIVVLLLVGLFGAKTFLLKPKPLTPEQQKAAKEQVEHERALFCAGQNDYKLPAEAKKKDDETTTSTTEPVPQTGPILEMDARTFNLADPSEKHYLKLGIALQLPVGTVIDEAKSDGLGAPALSKAIALFSTKTMADLESQSDRDRLRSKLGYELCTEPDSEISTVYFTDFVMQ